MVKVAPIQEQEVPTPLSASDWQRWREYGHAPIYIAALITLDIRPTPTIESVLREHHPERYSLFRKRCRAIDKNYGHHQFVPRVKHKHEANREFGKVVDLVALCNFARIKRLEGAEVMIRELGFEAVTTEGSTRPGSASDTSATNEAIPPREPDPAEQASAIEQENDAIANYVAKLPAGAIHLGDLKEKGLRYAQLEIGALMHFLEEVLTKPGFNKKPYVKGERIVAAQVGRRLHAIFLAHGISTFEEGLHDAQTFAKHVGSAKKLFDNKPPGV